MGSIWSSYGAQATSGAMGLTGLGPTPGGQSAAKAQAAAKAAAQLGLSPAGAAAASGTSGGATSATGAATAASGTSTSSSSTSSTVSANDFLTLLVTEMKNQDPTADTDPNAYVNQLVSINSLEQLISINSGIQSLQPSTTGATGSSVAGSTATSQIARPVAGTDPF